MAAARTWPSLIAWLAIVFGAGWISSRFEPGAWYADLGKPPWTPPAWVFGPVWTLLYVMMAVAASLVWNRRELKIARMGIALFALQLVLNGLWTWIFFGLQSPGLAFADIVLLWLAIAATIAAFWSVNPLAGALLVPYLAWVTFAALLNFVIWQTNRGA
jgi:tryptophan-rich sensory protein